MQNPSLFLLSFLILTPLSLSSENMTQNNHTLPAKEKYIKELTPKNFRNFTLNHTFALVSFYSPNCIHCKNLAPIYSEVAEEFTVINSTQYGFGQINEHQYTSFTWKYNIIKYPTLLLFYNGYMVKELKQQVKKKEQIIEFLKEFKTNVSEPWTVEKIEDHLNSSQNLILFYGDDVHLPTFYKAKSVDGFLKIELKNDSVAKHFLIEKNTFVLMKNYDERRDDLVIDSDFSLETLNDFIEKNSEKIVTDLDLNSYLRANLFQFPSCYLIVDSESKQSEKEVEMYRKVIKIVRRDGKVREEAKVNKTIFSVTDIHNKENNTISMLLLSKIKVKKSDKCPILICHEYKKNVDHRLEPEDYSFEKIKLFIENYLNGKLAPKVKVPVGKIPDL